MSKSTDVRTPGIAAIAKKWNLPLAKVVALVNQGAEVEKEHTKVLAKAKQVARDHINERPDYYHKLKKMEKSPISMSEDAYSGVDGVRGLGNVTGDPSGTLSGVDQYITTNAMAYEDLNGNILKLIRDKHANFHNNMGFTPYTPNELQNNLKEGMSSGADREIPIIGDLGGGRTLMRPLDVKEGARLDKAKKAAMAGVTAANLYTAGDVMSRAAEGKGRTKGDVVRMATTLPGAAGWAATGVHYAKKAYDKVKHMKEDKDPCWKGYEMVGMKKKGAKKVPNCVPVKESEVEEGYSTYSGKSHSLSPVGSSSDPLKNKRGADRTLGQYTRDFPANYAKKKISKQLGDVKSSIKSNLGRHTKPKHLPEEQIDEISAELVGKVSNARWRRGEVPSKTLSRAINKKFIESGKKLPEKPPFEGSHKRSHEKSSTHVHRLAVKAMKAQQEKLKEAAMDVAASGTPAPSGLRPTSKLGRNAPTEISTRGQSQGLNRTGNTFKPTSQITPGPRTAMRSATATPTTRMASQSTSWKPSSVSGPSPTASAKPAASTPRASFGTGGGSMKPTSVSTSSSPIQKIATATQKSMEKIVPRAASVAAPAARMASGLGGVAGAAVGAAAPALGKAMQQSHQASHQSMTPHATGGEKASTVFDRMRSGSQGRSVSQYEKDVLTPKASEAPKPKVDAPTPPSRPDYFSRGQAFSAARGEAGGGSGKFSYDSKSYQTNVKGEPYKPASQLKPTSVKEDEYIRPYDNPNVGRINKPDVGLNPGAGGRTVREETKMDTKEIIDEALDNILDENLVAMKENFLEALQEKAVEKLEERKKDIAASYFGQ